MHNVVEKTFENSWKKGMIGQVNKLTTKSSHLVLHMTSGMLNAN
jgi:hypothetical protein